MKASDDDLEMPIKKYEEVRPWGSFERFTNGQPSTVKIISINPDQELSLQTHKRREEFWRILFGSGKVIVGQSAYEAAEGGEFFVPKNTRHRIIAGQRGIKVLEISLGDFDEEDIVRLEDDYGRVS